MDVGYLIYAQLRPDASANSVHRPQRLIQSQFDSILQGKVEQRYVVLQSGHPGGVGSPNWPSPLTLGNSYTV